MSDEYAIIAEKIQKKISKFQLNVENLKVPKGYVTALIGENGAGKSTLLNILDGCMGKFKDICYFDKKQKWNEKALRGRIGYVASSSYFMPEWTVKQVKDISKLLFSDFSGERFDELCEQMDMKPDSNTSVMRLSDGERMRLMLATAFARKSELLLMDEPTSPLDPLMRERFMDCVRKYMAEADGERSILLSTHNIADMENITDYVILMDKGRIFEQGFVTDLKEKYLLVKGEPSDAEFAEPYLIGMQKNSYGFEGLCKADRLEKLAGRKVITELPSLYRLSVGLMEQAGKERRAAEKGA